MRDYEEFNHLLYGLNLGVSTENFAEKPIRFNNLHYKRKYLKYDNLIAHILKGHCFCHNYNSNDFTVKDKTEANFSSTKFVWLDIDSCDIDLNNIFQKISYKPNIAYTTFSNALDGKGFRYRFIYLLNWEITSNEEYNKHVNIILNTIKNDLGVKFVNDYIDKSCYSTAQQFIGNAKSNCELKLNRDYNYTKELFNDILKDIGECTTLLDLSNKKKREETVTIIERNSTVKELIRQIQDFDITTYHPLLTNINQATLDEQSIYTDVEAQNIYQVKFLLDENHKETKVPKGVRNKVLFYQAIVIRNLSPDISLLELTKSLWWLYEHKYEKTKDFNLNDICHIAIHVMKLDNKTDNFEKAGKRKYLINPEYRDLSLEQKRKALGEAIRKKRDRKILGNYDYNKTVSENAKDLDVSKNSIYSAFNDNGITLSRDSKFQAFTNIFLNNQNASVRELMKLTKLSNKTVQTYKKRLMNKLFSSEHMKDYEII